MATQAREMLSNLLQQSSKKRGPDRRRRVDSSMFPSNPNTPSPGPASRREYLEPRHATADFTEAEDDEDEQSNEEEQEVVGELPRFSRYRHDSGIHEGDGRRSSTTMIPLFSASHLDSLPIYNLVHSIRIIIQTRTETSLTWDQLKSPQVSQFLVKPMQQQIRNTHLNRATLYALMANCLGFKTEGELYPANAGTSSTRAKVCELLALKLLKEYSTRELIDALSYDFYPLQGAPESGIRGPTRQAAARTSTLEVAIRASAKHFLSHPLVVQQLEAIWNGSISFYSSADQLHRKPPTPKTPVENGARSPTSREPVDARTPLLRFQAPSVKEDESHSRGGRLPLFEVPIRRTVALYNPHNASPMKLSRLRVPRYRQFFSTCSLFILICLFLAVLVERSNRITSLELVFWFWSAGFMLDEVVGFNEQGFSLYIMSFWNIFDIGILLLLVVFYCMRIYGVFLVEAKSWNDMAYDVLAANAILLLPRIFSVLDHYQYFSQLLIAFRLMAVDLAAVFILILISCSGFFVFFTLSRNNNDAPEVAYKIFQILMGFTPAAWDVWPDYNPLGRVLLAIFLIICHFVVVTILITVLTNSFTAIASNAEQEHQFLFAINTISMVKNDALFSYVAPGNIIAWLLMPLRYVMPMRDFVRMNRTAIKLTHWPLLLAIFCYEKYVLASDIYEPTDLVENQGRSRQRLISFADPASRAALWSPNIGAREGSVVGQQKDQALAEVFWRVPDAGTFRQQRRQERRKSQTAIRNWMDQNDDNDGEPLSHWPTMDSRRSGGSKFTRRFRTVSDVRSAASDPADLMSNNGFPLGGDFGRFERPSPGQQPDDKDQTDADGDDELVTNDEDEDEAATEDQRATKSRRDEEEEDYFTTPVGTRFGVLAPASLTSTRSSLPPTATASPRGPRRQGMHSRTLSTNTILYAPQEVRNALANADSESEQPVAPRSRPLSSRQPTAAATPASSGTRSPRRSVYVQPPPSRPRPVPSKTAPDRPSELSAPANRRRAAIADEMDMNSDLGLDTSNVEAFSGIPASFQTQMAWATGQLKGLNRKTQEREDSDRLTRLMLAKMKALEERFDSVAQIMRSAVPTAQNSADDISSKGGGSGTGSVAIEILGKDRRRPLTAYKRSKDEKSQATGAREDRPNLSRRNTKQRTDDKGKGKAIARSYEGSSSDDEKETRRIRRRGSSF
ncbi:putative Ion transport domain-containing protein [Seiridium unicorne]|uniref:Ion transport domain-containing protein n=1 Tax=Seiridium unicorne TaxID=138068 RepID=A0ABR2V700_9PEZI